MSGSAPLAGIRVLELAWHVPGCYAGQILADHGADVVKVEPPHGDPLRGVPPLVGETSAYFLALNRDKRSVRIDLKTGDGRRDLEGLLSGADVLIQSFRPGVAQRLGIDYPTLARRHPRLVYAHVTSFGSDNDDPPAHDPNLLALSGWLDVGEREAPRLPPVQVGDLVGGGLMAVVGVLSALRETERSGQGRLVDVSMLDGTFALMGLQVAAAQAGAPAGPAPLSFSGGLAWCDVYETRDHRHVVICPLEPPFFARLCEVLGLQHRQGDQFDPSAQAELRIEFAAVFRTRTQNEWNDLLSAEEVCYSPVRTLDEACRDPRLVARRMVPAAGEFGVGDPLGLGRSVRPVPDLGQHNHDLLGHP